MNLLSECSDGLARSFAFIQDTVHSACYGHFYVLIRADYFHQSAGVVAFSDHIHFHLGRTYGIALPDHISEQTVPTELRVSGHQQIAQVGRICNVSLDGVHIFDEAFQFANGIAYQHRLKVVSIP